MFTENKTTELKREYVDDIKNTAIAFANCDGGSSVITKRAEGAMRSRRRLGQLDIEAIEREGGLSRQVGRIFKLVCCCVF